MKKWISLLLAAVLVMGMSTLANAEEKKSLSDFSSRLLKKAATEDAADAGTEQETAQQDKTSFGTPVYVSDPFFEKVRSSAYLNEDKYSKEANVMIELKNVSGRTLYPSEASIAAYNVAGEVLDEETYSSVAPDMVADGESLYVWDWFYNFPAELSEIDHFEVTIETETSSYRTYAKIEGEAMVSDGIAFALVENTTEEDIYGLRATVCIENEDGVLQDICDVSTGNAIGIFPGSVMILRSNARDYANDGGLAEGIATVSALYQVD